MDRATLLAAFDKMAEEKPRLVHIRGLGDVHIREIVVGEIDDQISDTAPGSTKRNIARGACRLLCDENGNRLLDPNNPDDVQTMMDKCRLRVLTAINAATELEDAIEKK